jgi:ribonuclease HI
VLITSRKLRHYFQEYLITVVTDYPLGDILRNQDASGRISKLAVELGAFNIDFKPRTAIKSQPLVDFMAEWRENQLPSPTERPEHWVMYFDGSLKIEGAGAGLLLISPMGEQLKYILQIFWKVSNNKAEYEALLHGLRLAISLGIKRLLVYGDSAVVIKQVNKSGSQQGEHGHLLPRSPQAREQILGRVPSCRPQQQLCSRCPIEAWFYSRTSTSGSLRPRASHAILPEPAPTTTDPAPSQVGQEVMMIDVDWRQPFINYIREQKVPIDKNLAEQIICRAKSYVLVGDKLYRRGATSGVLMKCVP